MTILNHQQAKDWMKKWKEDHPEEAEKFDREVEVMMKDPELLKKWLEKKGFHFPEEVACQYSNKLVENEEKLFKAGRRCVITQRMCWNWSKPEAVLDCQVRKELGAKQESE